ncbi:MAG: ABC transporter ATP-binding protein [Smithellaceae bacterium]|jgi:tungstate transport system ATP-binding protein|nr:ABC transporter ATP-binding protein [Smithellaceae bacterium]
MNNILTVQNLIVRRGGVKVLDIGALNVQESRILALIGPNGAGKSTLLLTMAGLLKPDQGEMCYKNRPVKSSADRSRMRKSVCVVFQEPLLLNTTVYKNVALGLKFRSLTNGEIRKNVEDALDYFGISSLAGRSAKTLSGGESKRVSLARAFALKPELILMDEAFNSLDPPTRETLIDDLRHILEETKITAVLALHDREETLRLAQDVTVMSEGRLIQSGATAQIFNQPDSEFVASFVGTETILEGTVKKSNAGLMEISIAGKTIEAMGNYPPGQDVYCCIRPENITVLQDAPEKTSARNTFKARIQKIVRQAFFYKMILDCGFPVVAYVTVSSCDDLGLCEGSTIIASFKATAVHVMKREK